MIDTCRNSAFGAVSKIPALLVIGMSLLLSGCQQAVRWDAPPP